MIGREIKAYRKKKGWTQEELARESGMSKISIGHYERGDRCPTFDILKKITNALNVPINCFLNDNEYTQMGSKNSIPYTGDGLLSYLKYLNYKLVPSKESEKKGYYITSHDGIDSLFLDFETLDRLESMIEVDIKKLITVFGISINNNGE
nr:helix-turn-helix transcriptional regulator [uncultured Aminipila sp.]